MSLSGVELSGTSFFFFFFFCSLGAARLEGNTEKKKFPLLTKKKKKNKPPPPRFGRCGLKIHEPFSTPGRPERAVQVPQPGPAPPGRGTHTHPPAFPPHPSLPTLAGFRIPPLGTAVKAKGAACSPRNAELKATRVPERPAGRHG